MREQPEGQSDLGLGRHPGIVILTALILAIWAFRKSSRPREVPSDTTNDDVPLFI